MKKYNFDLNYLIKIRNDLTSKVDSYTSTLETYQGLIDNYDKRINPTDNTYLDVSSEVSISSFLNEIFKDTNMELQNILLPAKNIIINYDNSIEEEPVIPLHLNNEQLVDYTIDLIRQIPNSNFVNLINSCVESEDHLLHIKHKSKLTTDFYGITFIDYINHRPYGIISRGNTIEDIITLGHELFHMVINKDAKPFSLSPYSEAEGYLANMIMCDLLRDEFLGDKEVNHINTIDLFRNNCTIYDSFITMAILNHLKTNGKPNMRKLNTYLKEEKIQTPVRRYNYQAFFHSKYNEDLNDAFSYLVALDLYDLYKKDPEKTINSLFTVSKLKGENIEKELESVDVTFTQDGYQNLDNTCKKLLKKTTLYN